MKVLHILILLFSILFIGCEKKSEEIKISVNTWVGFTPIMYAYEKGWLEPLNIKIYPVVSLGESIKLYRAGITDGFSGTQRELFAVNSKNLKPLILLDRSNGADVILSNMSLDELKKQNSISTYLELESINKLILDNFIKKYQINKDNLIYFNKEQSFVVTLRPTNTPTLISTYEPYSSTLIKNGFKEISSTKDIDMLVLDALYLNEDIIVKNTKRLKKLKEYIDKSLESLTSNPKEYYEVVKPYLEGQSYEEFISSLSGIEWINKNISKELKRVIENNNIPLERVIY